MTKGLVVPAHLVRTESNPRLCFVTVLILVIATVSWRRGVYYSGGLDSVVAGKALLSVIALTMAGFAHQGSRSRIRIRGRTLVFLVSYLMVSVFGAYAEGQLLPSAVLAVRVLIVALALYYLVRVFPRDLVFRSLIGSFLIVAIPSSITGLPMLGANGRLFGGIPPLHANEIATLFSVPLIGLTWLALRGAIRWWHTVLLVVSVGMIWLTGSRTALAAVVVALLVMLLQARDLTRPVAAVVAAAIPVGFYLMFASELLDRFFLRGGTEQLTTLSSRTIAWSAAWQYPDTFWSRWVGAGLAQKLIPVRDQWWDVQLLDSTWVSALIQAGLLGLLILGMWLAMVAASSLRARPPTRALLTALLVFLVIRSVLESGLFDSTPAFLTFMLMSLTGDNGVEADSRIPSRVNWIGIRRRELLIE